MYQIKANFTTNSMELAIISWNQPNWIDNENQKNDLFFYFFYLSFDDCSKTQPLFTIVNWFTSKFMSKWCAIQFDNSQACHNQKIKCAKSGSNLRVTRGSPTKPQSLWNKLCGVAHCLYLWMSNTGFHIWTHTVSLPNSAIVNDNVFHAKVKIKLLIVM